MDTARQLRDRARLHADGTLELVGRSDLRVKVHGQAVDLEVVEQALCALPGIHAAVVSLVSGRHGQSRLVAHVVGDEGPRGPRELRLALAATLPPFAIPATFVHLHEMPRNARGKVDRAQLREMAASGGPRGSDDVAPRTPQEEAIADLVTTALGVGPIGIHDDIFDLGADSLTLVGLLTAIGGRLGLTVSVADLLAAPTVHELAALVGRERGPHSRVMALMHRASSGTPVFCVPGAGAGVMEIRPLGQKLDRPVYAFVPHGFDQRAWPDRTVARAAERYVAALRDVQPQGPYVVAGVSFGCLVAFEMAQQLAAAGAAPAWLILVDPVTSASPAWSLAKPMQRLRAERAGLVPSNGPVALRLAGRIKRLFTDRYLPITAGVLQRSPEAQAAAFLSLNRQMTRRYRPKTYTGRVLLLRTTEWNWFDEVDITRFLSGETRVRTIVGRHHTMLHEPSVSALAAIIREETAGV